jgi:hypothetical protein
MCVGCDTIYTIINNTLPDQFPDATKKVESYTDAFAEIARLEKRIEEVEKRLKRVERNQPKLYGKGGAR